VGTGSSTGGGTSDAVACSVADAVAPVVVAVVDPGTLRARSMRTTRVAIVSSGMAYARQP
jgi:hypothetical protein